jgi:hypothetical protein
MIPDWVRAPGIRTAEPFDVPLPPHGDAVLHGGDA